MHPPLDVPSAPSRSSTDSTVIPRSRIAFFNAAVGRRDRRTLRTARATAYPRSARHLISGFGKSVTATPPWSQRATLAWPEFELPVTTRFGQGCRVCLKTLTRSGSRKPPVNPAASVRNDWRTVLHAPEQGCHIIAPARTTL